MKSLPLEDFCIVADDLPGFLVPNAKAEVDGDDWGLISLSEIQRRLVEDDDLAVVQLEAEFECPEGVEGLVVDVFASGLRQINLDGRYLVPQPGAGRVGMERYVMPSPLEAGPHRFDWSYIWNPPADLDTGEVLDDGVSLLPLAIKPAGCSPKGALIALPEDCNLARIEDLDLNGNAGVINFVGTVSLPANGLELVVDGGPDDLELFLDDVPLPRSGGQHRGYALPPQVGGGCLTVRMKTVVVAIAALTVR